MKKLLCIGLIGVSLLSGCATQSLDKNVGGHCVSKSVSVGDMIGNLRVQWIGGTSAECTGNMPLHAKMVIPSEFIHPNLYKMVTEDASLKRYFALHLLTGSETAAAHNELEKIRIRDCLLGHNLRALSCIPRDTRGDDVYVNGYYRSNGTYVQGHYRTRPNGDKTDNYSYDGNINPYTGKRGNQK